MEGGNKPGKRIERGAVGCMVRWLASGGSRDGLLSSNGVASGHSGDLLVTWLVVEWGSQRRFGQVGAACNQPLGMLQAPSGGGNWELCIVVFAENVLGICASKRGFSRGTWPGGLCSLPARRASLPGLGPSWRRVTAVTLVAAASPNSLFRYPSSGVQHSKQWR